MSTPDEQTHDDSHQPSPDSAAGRDEDEVEVGDASVGDHGSDVDDDRAGDDIDVSGVSGHDNVVYGQIRDSQFFKDPQFFFETYVGDLTQRHPQRLTRSHFLALDTGQLVSESASFLCGDMGEIQRFLSILRDRRLLVLSGEPELGKETLARYLAACLCQEPGFTLAGALRYAQSPPRDLRISFEMLCGKERSFRGRVVILKDAYHQKNADLIEVARVANYGLLDSYRTRLVESESFLILTSDTERIPEGRSDWQSVVAEASAPREETLRDYLELACERFLDPQLREKAAGLLASKGDQIPAALHTIPRVERFVRSWLVRVIEEDVSLEVALERSHQLDHWLLEDLAADLETLSYALALVLCHADSRVAGVPWFQFESLRQEVYRHLRICLRRHGEALEPQQLCCEEETLRLLEAEVQAIGGGAGDMVCFVKDQLAERLWGTLFGPGRRLLATLVPLLEKLTASKDFFLRHNAARALGRFGQIDPYGVTLTRIGSWSRPGDGSRLDALGPLLQGVLSSDQKEYRNLCLGRFRNVVRSRYGPEARAGILALKALAGHDLELVMGELKWVAEERLEPRLQKFHRLHKLFKHFETKVQQTTGSAALRRAVSKDLNRILVDALEAAFPREESQIFAALQYAIVGLCFELDAHRVLDGLAKWMPAGNARLAPLLALMFLRANGVADILERYPVEAEDEAGATERWSQFLFWAHFVDERMACLRDFLFEIYLGIGSFPELMQRALRWRFVWLLKKWSRQACEGRICRPGVLALLAGLLDAPDPQLRDEIFELLQRDSDFTEHGSKLASLAAEVLTVETAAWV